MADIPTRLTRFEIEPLRTRLLGDPAAAFELAMLLAAQVRDLRAPLELRNVRSARARLAAWLRLNAKGSPPVVRLERPWTEAASSGSDRAQTPCRR